MEYWELLQVRTEVHIHENIKEVSNNIFYLALINVVAQNNWCPWWIVILFHRKETYCNTVNKDNMR